VTTSVVFVVHEGRQTAVAAAAELRASLEAEGIDCAATARNGAAEMSAAHAAAAAAIAPP